MQQMNDGIIKIEAVPRGHAALVLHVQNHGAT